MEGTTTKNALLAASLGAIIALSLFFLSGPSNDPEPLRDVAVVRHADAAEAPKPADVRPMVASYYASSLEGNQTASGETYQPERRTAAHRNLPLGTKLEVSYRGESVRVTVNDRGPYVPDHDLDLSLAAAEQIGLVGPGTAPVRVTVL